MESSKEYIKNIEAPTLNKLLTKMKVNIPLIVVCFLGGFFFIVSFAGMVFAKEISEKITDGIFALIVLIVTAVLGGLFVVLHRKKNNIPMLIKNMREIIEIEDEKSLVYDMEESVSNRMLYQCQMFVVTEDYFFSWGECDTNFRPLMIPRNKILKVKIRNEHAGIGVQNSRNLVILDFILDNEKQANCCIGIGNAQKEMEQINKYLTKDLEVVSEDEKEVN